MQLLVCRERRHQAKIQLCVPYQRYVGTRGRRFEDLQFQTSRRRRSFFCAATTTWAATSLSNNETGINRWSATKIIITIMRSSFLLLCSLSTVAAFVAPGRHTSLQKSIINSDISQTCSSTELFSHKLVLVRHGESEWNDLNIFTGWADAALNEKGVKEARQGGQLLKDAGYTFDVAYTSVLKRAIKTLWLVLEEMDLMYIPIVSSLMYCVMKLYFLLSY